MKLHCASLAIVLVLLCISLRLCHLMMVAGRDSSAGIATCHGLDCPGIRPDWLWYPTSLLYNGYRIPFPGVALITQHM